MQYSKHNFIRKQLNDRTYVFNQNYHLKRISSQDKVEKRIVIVNRCDLCDDQLPQKEDNLNDNLGIRMKIIDEIDSSFESDYDKSTYECGPKLILCNYCKREYLLPSYQ